MTILREISDSDGRRVELTVERWSHSASGRRTPRTRAPPRRHRPQDDIVRTVAAPDKVRPGRRSNERWYFLRDAGPSRWLQVVVAYEADRGWIVTAFGRRRDP